MGGSSSSRVLTVDDVVKTIRPFRDRLSDKDKALFQFAKLEVTQSSGHMEDTELFLDFKNHDPITVRAVGCSKPKSRMYVGYDSKDKLVMKWEDFSFWRQAKHVVVQGFQSIIPQLPAGGILSSIAAPVMGAITHR